MNRRSLLQSGGLTIISALAGCSAFESPEAATVSVSEIEIRNRLEREIDVSILLLDDGEAAYWRQVTLSGPPNPFAALNDLPATAGEYVLHAHLPETDEDTPVRVDLADVAGDRSCIRFHMEVTIVETNEDSYPSVTWGAVDECQDAE